PLLRRDMTVAAALETIRGGGGGQAAIYFYVIENNGRLAGVLQTRALLTAQPEERLADIMSPRVVAIPQTATVLDACEFFVLHKFLAFPVVDAARRIVGVVDIELFNEEVFGIPETQGRDELFQAIGFHIAEVRNASPMRTFRI